MRQTSPSFFGLISKALRGNYEEIARQPLPERWVDLIKYLDERERVQQAQDQDERSPQPRGQVH